jgi:organic radical activating enzyme
MCCSEKSTIHNDPVKYNIKNMTVAQWFTDEPLTVAREMIRGNTPLQQCRGCYQEEHNGYESRRIKENFKSVIFTEQAFDRSYKQGPMRDVFENPIGDRKPIDWHVDLGNECNLACKMCKPEASSKISSLYTKWKLIDASANRNWTSDPVAWQNFLNSILAVPNLNRIHFMGGEPLLNKKFLPLLDFLLHNKRNNISISFVTNGTMVNTELIDRLRQFRSCDIEVSLESVKDNNHYIRQGLGDVTQEVLANIQWLCTQQTDTFHVVLRSVPQLLNINNYDQYIKWAWNMQLPIQGIPLIRPEYLQISVLPLALRKTFISRYQTVKDSITPSGLTTLATGRGTGTLDITLRRECDAMIAMLSAPEPNNVLELRQQLAEWLMRWDREFDLNAFDYYPEYQEFLNDIQYRV